MAGCPTATPVGSFYSGDVNRDFPTFLEAQQLLNSHVYSGYTAILMSTIFTTA